MLCASHCPAGIWSATIFEPRIVKLERAMRIAIISALFITTFSFAQTQPAWVAKSNQNAQLLLAITATYGPEGASREGVQGLDEQITVPSGERFRQRRAD